MENLFVVGMGLGTVFVGLICIIILCKIIGLIVNSGAKKKQVSPENPPSATKKPIENRQEIIAAVSAVIAEELGKDISAIRIHSFKKL